MLSKTDKEITAEIVCEYLRAWSGDGRIPARQDELPSLIETIYNTIRALPNDSQCDPDSGK